MVSIDPYQLLVGGVLILVASPFATSSLKTRLIRAFIAVGIPSLLIAGFHLYGVLTTCGLWVKGIPSIGTEGCKSLPLAQCEDLHVHKVTGLVFGVCHDLDPEIRYRWFPGMGLFKHPEDGNKARARIHVIDPKTLAHQAVPISNFDHSFVGHGFDIWQDQSDVVYLHAVNHPPNPDFTEDDTANPKFGKFDFKQRHTRQEYAGRDQVEIFKIAMPANGGMPSAAEHVRSVRHPLLVAMNDLVATGPDSFYVTNDHHYLDGHMRELEQFMTTRAPWTNIIHVTADLSTTGDAASSVNAHVALDKTVNANGLGRGPGRELMYLSAVAGLLHRLVEEPRQRLLAVKETFECPTTVDNPFYLQTDSPATSGYYLSGLPKALDLASLVENSTAIVGSNVLRIKRDPASDKLTKAEVIFQDDGHFLKTGSIAVVVPTSATSGQMVVSGPWSDNVVVCPITL